MIFFTTFYFLLPYKTNWFCLSKKKLNAFFFFFFIFPQEKTNKQPTQAKAKTASIKLYSSGCQPGVGHERNLREEQSRKSIFMQEK